MRRGRSLSIQRKLEDLRPGSQGPISPSHSPHLQSLHVQLQYQSISVISLHTSTTILNGSSAMLVITPFHQPPIAPLPVPHAMADIKLPGISELTLLSPPPTPISSQSGLTSGTYPSTLASWRWPSPPDDECVEAPTSSSSHYSGSSTSSQYGRGSKPIRDITLRGSTQLQADQQQHTLPPISHILLIAAESGHEKMRPPVVEIQRPRFIYPYGLPSPLPSPTSSFVGSPSTGFGNRPHWFRSQSLPEGPSEMQLRPTDLYGNRASFGSRSYSGPVRQPHRRAHFVQEARRGSRRCNRLEPYSEVKRRDECGARKTRDRRVFRKPYLREQQEKHEVDMGKKREVDDEDYVMVDEVEDYAMADEDEDYVVVSSDDPGRQNQSYDGSNLKKEEKHCNKPYTFEQEIFFIYLKTDLGLTWGEVAARYMERFPKHLYGAERSVGGLNCSYYRTNSKIPATTKDGLMIFDNLDPRTDKHSYKGVKYKVKHVQCRTGEVSLFERFPEELVDEKNDWVLPEHREMARDIAARRARQREEWIRAHQNSEMAVYF
ncbi:hypothetical protein B0T19DRAFT_116807 [Cercophora scortea]|uniref:Uncharacterized protein n=1 Tax=Cercophora scortea TaxID=314031 RepID=A0AAE0IXP2_9PEZI|nr:hypothetical protein B0T19DRAFT_116807 [Cercophora scortea]